MKIERQYRVKEAARITGVKEGTWRRWIFDRKIRTTRLGACVCIPESEIARLISSGRVPARGGGA